MLQTLQRCNWFELNNVKKQRLLQMTKKTSVRFLFESPSTTTRWQTGKSPCFIGYIYIFKYRLDFFIVMLVFGVCKSVSKVMQLFEIKWEKNPSTLWMSETLVWLWYSLPERSLAVEKRNIFLNHQKPTRDESEFVPCSVDVGKSYRFPRKISIDFPLLTLYYIHLCYIFIWVA